MSPTFAKQRVRRASFHQKEAMLLFMEQHPEIGNEKLSTRYDISYKRKQWIALTKLLNKLPGKPKNPTKWQKAWQDWRYNTRKKVTAEKKVKLNNLEQRLLELSNFDFTQNSTTRNETLDEVEIKSEILEHNINDILETNLTEANNESTSAFKNVQISNVSTLTTSLSPEPAVSNNRTQITRQRRKYINYEKYNAKQIHRMAKCVEKSVNSVKRICKTQAASSSKVVSLLEENSRTLQSLAESQMRQAEALERQVSLEESRNSILKLIASTLNSVKKI